MQFRVMATMDGPARSFRFPASKRNNRSRLKCDCDQERVRHCQRGNEVDRSDLLIFMRVLPLLKVEAKGLSPGVAGMLGAFPGDRRAAGQRPFGIKLPANHVLPIDDRNRQAPAVRVIDFVAPDHRAGRRLSHTTMKEMDMPALLSNGHAFGKCRLPRVPSAL